MLTKIARYQFVSKKNIGKLENRKKNNVFVALPIQASKRLRTGDSFDERKIGKIKLNERNIFLSRDSCSCRAKRLRIGDSSENCNIFNLNCYDHNYN